MSVRPLNQARFKINGTPAEHPTTGDRLYAGTNSETLTGETKRAYRDTVLDRLRGGGLQVLVSTQLADEGLDVPTLDRIILATPSRSAGRTVQRLGRAMRPSPGKGQPVVFDLVDDHGIAQSQSFARWAAYRGISSVECSR